MIVPLRKVNCTTHFLIQTNVIVFREEENSSTRRKSIVQIYSLKLNPLVENGSISPNEFEIWFSVLESSANNAGHLSYKFSLKM